MNDQTTTSFEEAPASWNTRYITPDGFTCQLTLRGETGIEILKKAQAAMAWLREQGCQPYYSGGYQSVSNTTSQPESDSKSSTLDNGSPDPSWCPVHNVTMKRRERNGQVWFSHKANGQWCKGKSS